MTPTWLFRIPLSNDELIDETDNLEQVCSSPKKYLPSVSMQMQDLPIETAASAIDPDPEQTESTVEFFGHHLDKTQPLIEGLFSFGLTFWNDVRKNYNRTCLFSSMNRFLVVRTCTILFRV
jgi:hypothetical protein